MFILKQALKLAVAIVAIYFFASNPAKTQTGIEKTSVQIVLQPTGENGTNMAFIHCKLETDQPIGQRSLCFVGIYGRTNLTLYKPLKSQVFEARLFDQRGQEVEKTTYGKGFGLPLSPDKNLLDGSWRNDIAAMYGHPRDINFTNGYNQMNDWNFDIMKSFKIQESGEYRLQVQMRLFMKDKNGIFQPFVLPPVETKVNVPKAAL